MQKMQISQTNSIYKREKSAKESPPPAHVSFSPGSAVLNNPHFLKRFIFEKKAECSFSRQYHRTLDGVVCNHLMESHIKTHTHRQQSVASQSCLACRHFPIFLRMVDVKLSHLCVPTVKKVWEVNLGRSSSGACLDETRSVDSN